MTPGEYLTEVLNDQTLSGESDELADLRDERERVESLLCDAFGSAPVIKYGGSKAKHTMVKASFDLDVLCYFPRNEGTAGDTLKEIYDSVEEVLRDDYLVERKRSALRLLDPDSEHYAHVDVVPGRFVDDGARGDVYLYQESGEKERLKTNPDVHIEHIRDSGVRDAIKLAKVWNVRERLGVKTFVLELLVIEVLADKKEDSLPDQMVYFFETVRDEVDEISIEDPANREGNDLSDLFNTATKSVLSAASSRALNHIESDDWEAVFGPVEERSTREKAEALKAASASAGGSKPWSYGALV